ncbi:MAG TPA: 1-phosphofructokinase [Tissierellales bacterium]|nr:1-phosphofructokinase [Tissierellales bacterium]
MILTVTLNPSIDRRYFVKDFHKDKVFRTNEVQYTPGGKGLNVSRVINKFKEPVIATGVLGGLSGQFIIEKLDELEIENDFVKIKANTRSCIAILSDDESQTEILEPGPKISQNELGDFYKTYEKLVDKSEIICGSGSIPQNAPVDIYKRLIEIAREKNKKFILDTSGETLREGIKASPYMIKPNEEELESIIGHSINTERELLEAIKGIQEYGVKLIIVSLGAEGSVVCYEDKTYKVEAPKIKAINPVGSGDSMVAGIAVGLSRGYDFEKMIKLATSCGTANAMEKETGKVNINNVEKLMEEVKMVRIG